MTDGIGRLALSMSVLLLIIEWDMPTMASYFQKKLIEVLRCNLSNERVQEEQTIPNPSPCSSSQWHTESLDFSSMSDIFQSVSFCFVINPFGSELRHLCKWALCLKASFLVIFLYHQVTSSMDQWAIDWAYGKVAHVVLLPDWPPALAQPCRSAAFLHPAGWLCNKDHTVALSVFECTRERFSTTLILLSWLHLCCLGIQSFPPTKAYSKYSWARGIYKRNCVLECFS